MVYRTKENVAGGGGLQAGSLAAIAASLVVLVSLVLSYAGLWPLLHRQWTQVSSYTHGYLVAAVAIWLVWSTWRARPPRVLAPDWLFAAPLMAVLTVLSVAELLYLNVPRLYLVPLLIVSCVGLLAGREAAKLVLAPALLIYLTLPIWEVAIEPLRALTTEVVSLWLMWANVPVFIDGNIVRLPTGAVEIAEGCSGFRYLITMASLSACYSLAFIPTWPRRMLLLAVAVGIATLGNWIRVYSIILIGHLTEMQHPLVQEHGTYGWVLFGIYVVFLLWIARHLERRAAMKEEREYAPERALATLRPIAISVAAVTASGLIVVSRLSVDALSVPLNPAAVSSFELGRGWAPASSGPSSWRPVFANAIEHRGMVDEGGLPIEVYVGTYAWQDPDHRLIAYGNSFVPREWRRLSQRELTIESRGASFRLIEFEGYLGRNRRLVWGWYDVAGDMAIDPLHAKLLELKGLMQGRRDAAALAISASCEADSCNFARRQLEAFLKRAGHELHWSH